MARSIRIYRSEQPGLGGVRAPNVRNRRHSGTRRSRVYRIVQPPPPSGVETPGMPTAPKPDAVPPAGGSAPTGKGKQRGPGGFTPWQPTLPPLGLYDPAIDASIGQAQRGNRYLLGDQPGVQGVNSYDTGDLDTGQRRGDEDLAIGHEDIGRARGRSLADLTTNRTREGENYNNGVMALQRQFERLANQQNQAFRAAGLTRGGGLAAAIEKRAANQAFERQGMDLSHQRATSDLDRQQQRIHEDYGNPDVVGDYGLSGQRLQLGHTRGSEDRVTQASRATGELGAFESDARDSAWAQAKQTNPYLTEPMRPANERTVGNQTYQLYRIRGGKRKGQLWKRLPSGQLVPRTDMTTV